MVLRPLFNTETNLVLLPLYYGVETTQIWCYQHSNFNFSTYGTITIQIWYYYHSNIKLLQELKKNIYLRSSLLYRKRTMILKYYLF